MREDSYFWPRYKSSKSLNMKQFSYTLLILFCISFQAFAQQGQLDPSFAGDGHWRFPASEEVQLGHLVVQPNSKLLVGGSWMGDNLGDMLLLRLHEDGRLDSTFGTNGQFVLDMGENEFVEAMALQADGQVLLAGLHENPTSDTAVVIARVSTSGELDNDFGTNGTVTFAPKYTTTVDDLVLTSNGKIVISGKMNASGGKPDLFVAQFNTDGSLDNSFGSGGIFIHDDQGGSAAGGQLVVLHNGQIAVWGTTAYGAAQADVLILRLTSNGALDQSFGQQGQVVHDLSTYPAAISEAVLQPDGKMVGGGLVYMSSTQAKALAMRVNADGSLDNSFSGDGVAEIGNNSTTAMDILLQSDHKIVLAGIEVVGGFNMNHMAARLNPDGSLDQSFGNGGIAIVDSSMLDLTSGVALQPAHDRILMASLEVDQSFAYTGVVLALQSGSIVGMNEESALVQAFSLFPNPVTTDEIHLTGVLEQSGDLSVRVLDQTGRVVVQTSARHYQPGQFRQSVILPEQLENGLYFLEARSDRGIERHKFIILR